MLLQFVFLEYFIMSTTIVKVESLFGMLTIKLRDDNFVKWAFQFKSITTYIECESTDMALLSLLLATLFDEVIEYVLGCKTAFEAWSNLVERFASMSKSKINDLKIELHTIQKGSDSIDKYLLRLKNIREQLSIAGEFIFDNDVMIVGLTGLPKEYAIIRIVILARESAITLKEFHAQLLGAEKEMQG
ncbi:unnamed protein product [Malus baccata var. baccata]